MVTLLKVVDNSGRYRIVPERLYFGITIGRGYYRRDCTIQQLYQEDYRKKFPDLAGWYKEYMKQNGTCISTVQQMIGKPVHVIL